MVTQQQRLCLCLLVAAAAVESASAFSTAHLLRGKSPRCEPTSVAPDQRCSYVRQHADLCYPGGGFQEYLVVHYCTFGPAWEWLSILLLAAAALLALAVLLTVSERFFCPALELISDYLKLPPVVAGATLLSFGNGAPDTFTQVAAIGQEGGAAVGMALAEPLGGGLFASNVVFGLVVLIASRQQMYIQRTAFLKDVVFYLVSLLIIACLLADGKVTTVEACVMCSLYAGYVCVTFYTSRTDEPLHADVALHEVPPPDGGVDAPDSTSEDFQDSCSEFGQPVYLDATTSITGFDLEAPSEGEGGTSCPSSSPTASEQLPPRLPHAPAAAIKHAAAAVSSHGGVDETPGPGVGAEAPPAGDSHRATNAPSRTLQALLSWRHRGSSHGGGVASGLREPLLVCIEESPITSGSGQPGLASAGDNWEANSSGDTVVGTGAACTAARNLSAADASTSTDGSAAEHRPAVVVHTQSGVRSDPGGAVTAGEARGPLPGQDRHRLNRGSSRGSSRGHQDAPAGDGSERGGEGAGVQAQALLPSPAFAHGSEGFAGALQGLERWQRGQVQSHPQQPQLQLGVGRPRDLAAAHGRRSFSEGVGPSRLQEPAGSDASCFANYPFEPPVSPVAQQLPHVYSPRAGSDSMLMDGPCSSYHGLRFSSTPGAVGPQYLPVRLAGDFPPHLGPPGLLHLQLPAVPLLSPRGSVCEHSMPPALSPHWQQLQEQHRAEQAELLEQQTAEQVALLAAHDEGQLKPAGMSFKHKLQWPFVLLLSCAMPRVGTGSGHHYPRWRACCLPLTVPLLWLATDRSLLTYIGWPGLVFGAACACVGSAIIWATYPASHVPRNTLKGVFAVLAFMQAVVWLDISASALVQVCVVVGTIFGLQPALLGATILAWGNSVPDLINNVAMARDGFPSMAIAACFASPLFTLLVGMGGALSYGTVLHGGALLIPVDSPSLVMAGFAVVNMVQHLIMVPLVHRYKVRPSLTITSWLFYASFNVVYVLATIGVIRVKGFPPRQ